MTQLTPEDLAVTAAAEQSKRTKAPVYHVLKQVEVDLADDGMVKVWQAIGSDVHAATAKEAVRATLTKLGVEGEDRYGTYWTVLSALYRPVTLRGEQREVVEVWE